MVKFLKNHWLLVDGSVFHNLQIVAESTVRTNAGWIKLHNWKGLLRLRLFLKKKTLNKDIVYVTVHNSYRGYYHWLLESLPKILEAKKTTPSFTLLIPSSYNDAFYIDTLRLLKIQSIHYLERDILYRVPKLVLPYFPLSMGDYCSNNLLELKSILISSLSVKTLDEDIKRIYISRRKATRRKVVNELEVECMLNELGFQSICFEDYNFEEQIQLCSTAEIIVGIHGAGLSNILFLPKNATVVELRKFDNGENYFFTQLADALQHNYHLLYCVSVNEYESVQDADLLVNTAALKSILTPDFK